MPKQPAIGGTKDSNWRLARPPPWLDFPRSFIPNLHARGNATPDPLLGICDASTVHLVHAARLPFRVEPEHKISALVVQRDNRETRLRLAVRSDLATQMIKQLWPEARTISSE